MPRYVLLPPPGELGGDALRGPAAPTPPTPSTQPEPAPKSGSDPTRLNGRWRKGFSGRVPGTGGRAIGSMPLGEFRRQMRARVPSILEHIDAQLESEEPMSVGAAIQLLSLVADRAYGKAVQPIEIGGPGTFDGMSDEELTEFIERKMIELKAVTSGETGAD